MLKPLKVLFVEDSPPDAEIIAHRLTQQGFEPSFERVADASGLTDALSRTKWDVIICDYSLPGFSGAEALKIYKRSGLDVPFIVVSGRVGEEEAVEMMRAGAHDYVMKLHLDRLGAAIERELNSAEQRAQVRADALQKAHLASIVENSNDAIIGKNLDGIVLSWNSAAEEIYGYTAAEMIGRSISVLHPPGSESEFIDIMVKLRSGERTSRYQTFRVRKDGRVICVSLVNSPIKGSFGQIVGASSITRDITERHEQEEERIKLIAKLQEALAHVKTLSGLLPICASCKKIRDDGGYWQQVELYIRQRSDAEFTHSICPDCMKRLYPQFTINETA